MRKLVSIEKNGKMERTYQIQGIELETIKKLELPMPETIKVLLDLRENENLEKFYKFSDDISFFFINNQHWMVDEFDVVNLNLFELKKMLNYLIDEREKIIDSIRRVTTRDELEEIKVDLILNEYKNKCFEYLKKIKDIELKSKRK